VRLINAARRFDRTSCYDAYTDVLLFTAQLGLFDDNKRDSETAERRILSMAVSNVVPYRRVIDFAGTKLIIGHANIDTFGDDVLRVGYSVHEATGLATIRTLAQVCASAAGVSAYAGRAWVKNLAFSEQGSKNAGEYHIHFASTETVVDGALIGFGGRNYVARTSNQGAGGTLVVTSDEMAEPCIETGTIVTGTYDPVTEAMSGSSTSVQVVRIRWQSYFQYLNKSAPSFGPDDMQVAVPKTVTAVPGALLTLSDGVWIVASVSDVAGVWLCRATRHA
jgi:hypothetical protein